MIRVKIEIYDWKTIELSQIVVIKNDGSGDEEIGNYDVEAVGGGTRETYLRTRVQGFPRRTSSVLQLVRRAMNALGAKESG